MYFCKFNQSGKAPPGAVWAEAPDSFRVTEDAFPYNDDLAAH